MAKAAWLTTSPQSGTGNGTIENSAGAHTGRAARTTVVTVETTGGGARDTYEVTQEGAAAFLRWDAHADPIPAEGGRIQFTGKGNTGNLSFSMLPTADWENTEVNGAPYEPAEGDIPGDPGAAAEYSFSAVLAVQANAGTEDRELELRVETSDGSTGDTLRVVQQGAAPYVRLSQESISLPAEGTPAVAVQVESNSEWTVS